MPERRLRLVNDHAKGQPRPSAEDGVLEKMLRYVNAACARADVVMQVQSVAAQLLAIQRP